MKITFTACMTRAMVALAIFLPNLLQARPVHRANKSDAATQAFLRQMNTVSNVEFYYTNRGVLFNAGNGEDEGLFWPRGSGDSYIFGGGLWFGVQKDLAGTLHKLCEVGYNPNSGAGWYTPGEASQAGLTVGTDGANLNSKYISYISPRYDSLTGAMIPDSSSSLTPPYYAWPLWDTSTTKTFKQNFYFGDYIFDVNKRNADSLSHGNHTASPAIVSQEDIVNFYTDNPPTNNPEFVPGTGYPFDLDIEEEIYSWGYGSYQNIIFLRYKVKNSSTDTLANCWLAPAFDPDLVDPGTSGGAAEDANSYVDSALVAKLADTTGLDQLAQPYRSDPSKLNMAVQWHNFTQPPNGQQYGMIGFSMIESPTFDSNGYVIPNDDSAALGGYGPNSLFQKNQLGLVTCRDWTIINDPPDSGLARYNFISTGEKDEWNGIYGDQRLMLATGPFHLAPGQSAEATIAIGIAKVSNTSYKQNFDALLLLMQEAHQVFEQVDSTNGNYVVNHFEVVPQSGVSNNQTPAGLTLHDPYPNPFSNTVTVQYQNANAGEAVATVTDMLGREVQSILLGTVPAGSHTITLDGSGLAAGAYRITVVVGNETESQMVIRN